MRVSLITVTLNSAAYLPSCIKSVIHQDYHDIEYIIVDGGSTDATLAIVEGFKESVSHFISEKDRGMYDAINKGLKMATGDVIGILNSDDMLASTTVISQIVDRFKKESVDSVYGDLVYVDEKDTSKIYRYWKSSAYDRNAFRLGWMPAHPTFYIRREVVEQLGLYETHFHSAADFEFMTRYLFKHRVSSSYLPELFVKMRKGGMSNCSLKTRLRANRRDYLALKKNGVPFPFLVSCIKPIRKLPQFIGYLNAKKEKKAKTPTLQPV